MMRSFELTLPLTANWYNLLTQILAEVGAVPTDGYFPNPCMVLDLTATSGTFTLADSNHSGAGGQTTFHREFDKNVIDLSEYKIKGSADGAKVAVSVEAT